MEAEVLNISPAVVWVIALSQLLTFALTIWNLVSSGSRANARQLESHGDRLHDHDQRLNAVEIGQRSTPSKSDMHGLELAMERLKGEMKTMSQVIAGNNEIMARLEGIVSRHEDHLLSGGAKR